MDKRTSVIINMIKQNYKDVKFDIGTAGYTGETCLTFYDYGFTFTLIDSISWKDVKRFLDKHLNKKSNYVECEICLEKNYAFCPCNKCSNSTCMKCCAEIVVKNEGIMKCPFCCYEVGSKLPWPMVFQVRDHFLMSNYEINKQQSKK